MKALKVMATINDLGQLTLDHPLVTDKNSRVEVIRPLAELNKRPSSPSPFSQKGRRGARKLQFQSPSPHLGEGFRVRVMGSARGLLC